MKEKKKPDPFYELWSEHETDIDMYDVSDNYSSVDIMDDIDEW
jgi:hypothetical protein